MRLNYTVSYASRVEQDIKEAIFHYDKQLSGLGDRFFEEYLQYIEVIKRNPFIFQLRYKKVHLAPLRNFPFLIFYIIEQENILILSVVNSFKNPDKWPESI